MAITDFQLQWHTEKYGDVITAVETLEPEIFDKDPMAEFLRRQIDMNRDALYKYILKNHCVKDENEY
ncbi:TPA: hypothetical protein ACXHW4_004228 [Enterobacter hormaechei]